MRYLYSAILTFLLSASVCNAQITIKGAVFDTLNKAPLSHATITLVRSSDSVIETFTRARDDGKFELHVGREGKYMIMVTFPSFADYVDHITLKNKKTIDLGMIPMVSKNHLLQEYVLTQQYAAIKIKGDTTEYMADSFKVKEGATVEDLLKRLPGIQVDKNGQVTAQGETVQKILVDGEEFFSDDPAVVTKNLQSSVVDKVQVYDKKSDQAEFTGIDDGQKTKTINLQLKENKKNGYFGKVDAGGGTDGYFQDQGMINDFKGKQQISVFGIMSNTDKVGLGWTDNDKFGSGNGTTEITDEGVTTTFTNSSDDFSDWDGKYNGEGQPTVWTGGAHYANKWDDGAEHVTGNYRYSQQNVDIDGNTTTQYVLPGNYGYLTQQHKDQFSQSMRHGADGMFEWKLDSTSSLKLTVDGGYKDTKTSSAYTTYTEFEDTTAQNKYDTASLNDRKVTSNTTSQFINADLLYRKKFNKKGRTLSIDLKENYKNTLSDGQLYSLTSYNPLSGLPDSVVDQRKVNNSNTIAIEGKVTYTEPLSKVAYLEGDYGLAVNNSNAVYQSFDKPLGETQYTDFDSTYSSNYKYTILTNTGGLDMKFVYKKINFSFGSDVSDANYAQQDLMHDSTYNRNYFNLFPKASFTYKFDKQTTFNFNYYGSTRQPTIDQLQPLRQNTDPQNIQIGNPNLQQQFQNTVVMRYSDFKILTGRYLWASVSGNFINDAISTSQVLDPLTGVNTTQYVNVNGNYNGWGYVGYGARLSKLDMNVGGHLQTSVNHIISYVDGVKDAGDNSTYTFGLDFSYYKDKKYEIQFSPGITYNDNQSSISTFTTSYWSSDNNLNGSVQLPFKFEVGTNIDWFLRQQTAVFPTNNDVFRWNMYVSKKFLKKSQLELRAYVYDLLNQNIGYNRYAQGTMISEDTYNTIHRYGMLSLVWNFTKTSGGAPPPPEGGMMMMH